MQKIRVPYEYPVYFTEGVFKTQNPDLAEAAGRQEPDRRHRVIVVLDQGVAEAWPGIQHEITSYFHAHAGRLDLCCDPIEVVGGEAAKNDPALTGALHERFFSLHFDRQSFVVTVGGGAVQDLAGYAASTVHRGIRVIRIPTTVLSQNDSGVGVKNGVNAFGTKNFLGTFAPPFAVLNDRLFLRTLQARDKVAGMSEAVKVALIRDASFFDWLEENRAALARFEESAMSEMVRRGAVLHLDHIANSGDPFEFGSARPLDFGHWSAHKLESLTDYRLRHGEAVAIGMALDSRYSVEAGLLDETALSRIFALLESLGHRLWDEAMDIADPERKSAILRGLDDFREHLGGELTVTLLSEIGRGVEVHNMDTSLVLRSIDWLRERDRRR